MSIAHIRLVQTREDTQTVEYAVESPDFSKSSAWQAVGCLVLDKAAKSYEFRPAPIWTENKALPPELYGRDEAERSRLLRVQYKGCGWGAWAMIIHGYASKFLNTLSYPKKHPPAFFANP